MSLDGYHDCSSRTDLGSIDDMDRLAAAVQKRLSPFVFGRIRDCHAAEDVLQETLLTMIERLGELRSARCFWPWIYQIARRKIQDHFRRRERWATVKEDARHESENRFRTVYGEIGVLERMMAAEHAERLSEAILDLDTRQQQIVLLRCFAQMPYGKIAPGTGMTPAQARINLHRAKLHLKKRLHALSA